MTDLEAVREPVQRRAQDGSPIDLYRALPVMGEPELIHSLLPEGGSVLDLGCGVGRIAHALIALGHPVTAVDDSGEMLAEVRDAETVLSRIEDLRLGRLFDGVLLMSNLVNAPQCAAFLRTCREHVAPGGRVIVERMDPGTESGSFTGQYGPVHTEVEVARVGDEASGIVVYSLADGRTWTHRFGPGARILDDDAMRDELAAAHLELDRVLGPRRRWVVARPV